MDTKGMTRREFLRGTAATAVGLAAAACGPTPEGSEVPTNPRVRAWVLVEVEAGSSPDEVAKGLYDALGQEGGDDWVVVRADVVDGQGYSIVIPVDAVDGDTRDQVVSQINEWDGVDREKTLVLTVSHHNPEPAQDAHGYITPAEAEAGKEESIPGRQGNSPGDNAWG